MKRFVAILAVGLMAAAGRADDGPVTLKVKQPAAGDVIKESKTEKGNNKFTLTLNGKDMTNSQSVETKFGYTDVIVEKPAGAKRATKVKRTYEAAEITGGPKGADLGLAGKTVMIEKGAAGYTYTIDGKPVSGPAAELLGKEFGKDKEINDEDLLSKDPVKVGGTWKIDVEKLAKDIGDDLTIDPAKSSATGKLLKVYDKGGHKYGQVEVTLELAVTKMNLGPTPVELKAGSKATITATLDMCIDGSKIATSGTMKTIGTFEGAAMGASFKLEVNSTREGGSEEVEKK
jgi:hypothetical protein